MIIGTHSRSIEGKLFEFFQKLGWTLKAERPLVGAIREGNFVTVVDGVQYWKNNSLV
jgi:hypothetical protein